MVVVVEEEPEGDEAPEVAKGLPEGDPVQDPEPEIEDDDAQEPPLDRQRMRVIDKRIAKGRAPKEEGVVGPIVQPAALTLARRTRFLFWALVVQCALVVIGTAFVARSFLDIKARGIPTVDYLDEVQTAEASPHEVEAFAWEVTNRANTWNWWDWERTRDEMRAFFVPSMQGPFDEWFEEQTKSAGSDKKRQIAFRIGSVYRGVERDTVHHVYCCYELWEGLGTNVGSFEAHRHSDRIFILEIIEGERTATNPSGLYVIKMKGLDREAFVRHQQWDPWEEIRIDRDPDKDPRR